VKYSQTALAILVSLAVSLAFAEDFRTINGKEYKDAAISRVESDGIVLRTKSGISKVYFTELPKDVQERFHYNPAKATPVQREREQIPQKRAQQDARRQIDERVQQLHAPAAAADFNFLITVLAVPILVIAIPVIVIIVIVAVVRAKQRREQRARLFNQARDFTAAIQKNQSLPPVPTDIILKPGESAFYSTPSTLYETRAVNLSSRPQRRASCERRLYWGDKRPFHKYTTMGGVRHWTAHHHKPTVGVCRRERRSHDSTEENCFR